MKREPTTRESLGLKETETMCEKCTHEEICRREQCGEPHCVIRSCFDFEAKRPNGEWIEKHCDYGVYYRCSNCHKMPPNYECDYKEGAIKTNFCPNCGADMRKEGDTNDKNFSSR